MMHNETNPRNMNRKSVILNPMTQCYIFTVLSEISVPFLPSHPNAPDAAYTVSYNEATC